MTGYARSVANNAAWEVTRLRRSRRGWLLLIPVVAGPVGSAISDLYLKVPSVATAEILGLLITAGLSALVILDLTALAVGEDLALRTHLLTFTLPQGRSPALAARLGVVTAGALGTYALGAGGVWWIAGELVRTQPAAPTPILIPWHLFLGLFGLLCFLGGVVAAAGVVTRSSAQALVAGVLGGVVAAGVASSLLLQHQLTDVFPVVLLVVGLVGDGWAVTEYGRIDS